MTRRRALVAAAAVPLVVALVAGPGHADGSTVTGLQSGYWYEPEQSDGQIPPPPQVPANGLYVSSNAAGPVAESAVRFSLVGGASDPTVTLPIAQAQPSSSVSIVACPTTSAWTPPSGAGAWSELPKADCSGGAVLGTPTSDGTGLVFNLSTLVGAGGEIDVLLLPSAPSDPTGGALPTGGAPASTSPTFDASFQPLTATDVTAAPGTAPSSDTAAAGGSSDATAAAPADGSSAPVALGPPPDAALPAAGSSSSALPSSLPSSLPADTSSMVAAPAAVAPLPGASAAPAAAAPASAGSATAAPVAALPYSPARSLVHTRSWRDRLIIAFLLLDLVAFLAYEGRTASRGRPAITLYDAVPAAVAGVGAGIRRLGGRPEPGAFAGPRALGSGSGPISGQSGKRRHADRGAPPPIR